VSPSDVARPRSAAPIRGSAGILLFRRTDRLQVLLAHMGGPFWQRKDEGAWTLPKGEPVDGEDPVTTARREFEEELGLPVPDGALLELGEIRQSGGKVVRGWAIEGELDPAAIRPGTFDMEWPPRSGRTASFPEIDRVAWLAPDEASRLIVAGQRPFLSRLEAALAG
jgi:predicted NUDIX family NTP pyrophosphohydrolase